MWEGNKNMPGTRMSIQAVNQTRSLVKLFLFTWDWVQNYYVASQVSRKQIPFFRIYYILYVRRFMIARVYLLQSICREVLACKGHDQASHMSHLMVYGLSLPIVAIIPTLPTMFSRERET